MARPLRRVFVVFKRVAPFALLSVGGAALGFALVLVSEPALPTAPAAATPVQTADLPVPEPRIDIPAWTLPADSVQRIGYRKGRPQALEVVPLGPTSVEVEVSTARAFLVMREAASDAGVDLRLESGFRTVAQQRALYTAWKKGQGNQAAVPGRSNHQSGRALDIAVAVPGALAWLEANGASYGFKRTVSSEPWHWEYMDAPIARGAIISRKHAKHTKPGKHAKVTAQAKRPGKRPSAVRKGAHASGRVASIR